MSEQVDRDSRPNERLLNKTETDTKSLSKSVEAPLLLRSDMKTGQSSNPNRMSVPLSLNVPNFSIKADN
jgi:hypothetical protein